MTTNTQSKGVCFLRLPSYRRGLARGLLVGLALASSASAGTMQVVGPPTELVPLQNASLELRRERVFFRLEDSRWQGTARYEFFNPGPTAIALTLGFPEVACRGSGWNCPPSQFTHLEVLAGGTQVRATPGRLKPGERWSADFGTIWTHEVQLKAGTSLTVEYRFSAAPRNVAYGEQRLRYVTRTAALWKGPLEALFSLHFPAGTLVLGKPDSLQVTARGEDKDASFSIVIENREWAPSGDLDIAYLLEDRGVALAHGPKRLRPGTFHWEDAMARAHNDGQCSGLGTLKIPLEGPLTDEHLDVAARQLLTTRPDLRLCRNSVYARHGRIFNDPTLNEFFYGTPAPQEGLDRDFAWRPRAGTPKLLNRDERLLKVVLAAEKLVENDARTASDRGPAAVERPRPASEVPSASVLSSSRPAGASPPAAAPSATTAKRFHEVSKSSCAILPGSASTPSGWLLAAWLIGMSAWLRPRKSTLTRRSRALIGLDLPQP